MRSGKDEAQVEVERARVLESRGGEVGGRKNVGGLR